MLRCNFTSCLSPHLCLMLRCLVYLPLPISLYLIFFYLPLLTSLYRIFSSFTIAYITVPEFWFIYHCLHQCTRFLVYLLILTSMYPIFCLFTNTYITVPDFLFIYHYLHHCTRFFVYLPLLTSLYPIIGLFTIILPDSLFIYHRLHHRTLFFSLFTITHIIIPEFWFIYHYSHHCTFHYSKSFVVIKVKELAVLVLLRFICPFVSLPPFSLAEVPFPFERMSYLHLLCVTITKLHQICGSDQ
jgi:hypothetical protein